MIYFILSKQTGYIKIGSTNDLHHRFAQIRSTDGAFDVLGLMDGYMTEEQVLHKQFWEWRTVKNVNVCEWYHDNTSLRDYIELNTHLNMPEKKPSVRTGRPRGKKFETYLPQTACTAEMYDAIKALADDQFEGNIGAAIRASVQEKLDQTKKDSEPITLMQVPYR